MPAEYESASDYIEHHLSFLSKSAEGGGFWTVNIDSVITAIVLGIVGLGLLWWLVRGATAGVPGKRQAFVEVLIGFVDDQVKGIFRRGDRHEFVAPVALTLFVWIVLMNAMDFLPADWVSGAFRQIGVHHWRIVPTADVNTTFALSLSIFALMIWFSISAKGLGGWIHELFCAPFGKNVFLWPANFLFNCVEYVSKPLSHSLRLFGNMYAGEILFLLIWLWAAHSAYSEDYFFGFVASLFLGLGWAIFHILIVLLQAYIFMMLAVVYIAMAHEHH